MLQQPVVMSVPSVGNFDTQVSDFHHSRVCICQVCPWVQPQLRVVIETNGKCDPSKEEMIEPAAFSQNNDDYKLRFWYSD